MTTAYLQFRRLYPRWAGLALMLLTCGLAQRAYAQEPDALAPMESSKPDSKACSLAGTVINSQTGEPIRRALVSIAGQAGGATLTDNRGHFEFGGLVEGRVFVSVTKPGFFTGQGEPSGLIGLQVAADAAPVVLNMVPAGVIGGRVTTRDEQPLEGFQVHLITKQNVAGRLVWSSSPFFSRTDDHGDFRIANLPVATYYVEVDQSQETTLGQPGIPNARELVYAKVFYPGVADFSAAAPLELRAGQQLEANFTLAAEPIYQISGVASTHENPSSQLSFARKAGAGYDFTQITPTQDGKFQNKLPAGSYSVSGSTASGVLLSTPGASLVISSDSPDVHVVLAPAGSIEVAIRTEPARGAAEQDLAQNQGIPPMSLQLVSSAPSLNRPTNWWRAPSGGIQNVEPGVYSVEINTAGQWWVKSVRSGGVDLLSDDLTVSAGVQPSPIEVTLRDDAAAVVGTVAQADQAQPPTVLLVQPHGHRNLIKTVSALQGSFQFHGIPPGEYSLLAFDGADQLEYADPEVLNPYLSGAVHISLQPHGTASVNLNLSPESR
jgi:hypothetical protein